MTAFDCRFWRPNTIQRNNQLVYVALDFYRFYTEALIEIRAYNSSGQYIPSPFSDPDSIMFGSNSGSFDGYVWTSTKLTLVFGFNTAALAAQATTIHCWLYMGGAYYDYV